mmetsp:Transcript_15528/g.19878  ORF Transcript_15528/g.19878 Transcript_15528/m.19878 type:complete len:477 (-) Transcript_15528:95-1525(-)
MEKDGNEHLVTEDYNHTNAHGAEAKHGKSDEQLHDTSHKDGGQNEDWPEYCNPHYRMPEMIEVKVHLEQTGEDRYIPVIIEKAEYPKRYLGGYRHKQNGLIFHHASVQTDISTGKKALKDTSMLFSRDTQTAEFVTKSQQTTRESGTQMKRVDLYMNDEKDRVMVAKDYFSSEELLNLQKQHTVVLQRFWRGYMARKRAWEIRKSYYDRQVADQQRREEERVVKEAAARKEMQRRMNPRSVTDFEVLYNELEKWRAAETKRIRASGLPPEERQLQHEQLLHKETRLLQTIDRLKATAVKEGKAERIQKMLELISLPKKWELSDGELAEIHTPFTTRANELKELYNGLNTPLLSVDERLDVLLHVKWTVKEFDCPLTRDIVELIDREADLLNRGRSEKSLEGLRQRITNLFLRFIETPEFNPEAARFLKIPKGKSTRDFVEDVVPLMSKTLNDIPTDVPQDIVTPERINSATAAATH